MVDFVGMKMVLHKESTRGGGSFGWLNTRYSFSFNNWYDKDRMGFGALRVLNDDIFKVDQDLVLMGIAIWKLSLS
jgi:hypothetical protein